MTEAISYFLYALIGLWPILLIGFLFDRVHRGRHILYFFAYLPTSVLAALRANTVGTDTWNYWSAYELYDASIAPSFSPDFAFDWFVYFSRSLGLSFNSFSLLQSFSCLFLYAIGAPRIDRFAPVFGVGILPVLFIDSTFNGIRYGLAFAVAVVLLGIYTNSNWRMRGLLLIPPGLFHSSLLVLTVMSPILLLLGSVYVYASLDSFSLFNSFFNSKFEAYSSFFRPNTFSGLFPGFTFLCLYGIFYINTRRLFPTSLLGILSVFLFFGGGVLSLYSYAGLRFLLMSIFLFGVYVAQNTVPRVSHFSTWSAMVIGLLGLMNFYRQIFLVGPSGDVFFHPYEFANW